MSLVKNIFTAALLMAATEAAKRAYTILGR